MAQDALNAQLTKTNGNVRKLCEYFAARREWGLKPEARPIVEDLRTTAVAVGERLARLLAAAGAEPSEPTEPAVVSLGPGTYDGARLQRFATFLRDLETWFAAQDGRQTETEAVDLLRETGALVGCIIALVGAIAEGPPRPDPTPTEPAQTRRGPRRLVLDDTDERPLIQEVQNILELTPTCEKLADDYLDAWGIELSYYRRKKFLERLVRWISSAPEGQVLVIKMKTAEQPFEPYPSYVSREVLSGGAPSVEEPSDERPQ